MGGQLSASALVLKCAVSRLCSSPAALCCRSQLLVVCCCCSAAINQYWPAPSQPRFTPCPPSVPAFPARPQSTCLVWTWTAL
jgi:hypothetical protein